MSGEPRVIRRNVAWAVSLASTAAVFRAVSATAVHVAASPLLAYALGFGCVVVATLGAGVFAPRTVRTVLPIIVVSSCGLGYAYVTNPREPGWPFAVAVTIALLAAGSSLGALVGARIEHAGHVLFVASASALADVFSVFAPSGPSHAIAKSETALRLAALSWPMIGSNTIEAFLGVGDVVFTALYLATAQRHGLSLRRTLLALALGYCAAMLVVLGLQVPVPALPLLGAAMLVAHPEARRPPAADRRRGLVALSVMAAVFLVLLLRPHD
jgi:hypothetical protein